MREFCDLLSNFLYDVEGEVSWPEYLEEFYAFLADDFYAEEASVLLAYTLWEPPLRGARVCHLTACTHLSSYVISLNLLSVILIQNLLKKMLQKQIGLVIPWVVTCISFLNLHIFILMIL